MTVRDAAAAAARGVAQSCARFCGRLVLCGLLGIHRRDRWHVTGDKPLRRFEDPWGRDYLHEWPCARCRQPYFVRLRAKPKLRTGVR